MVENGKIPGNFLVYFCYTRPIPSLKTNSFLVSHTTHVIPQECWVLCKFIIWTNNFGSPVDVLKASLGNRPARNDIYPLNKHDIHDGNPVTFLESLGVLGVEAENENFPSSVCLLFQGFIFSFYGSLRGFTHHILMLFFSVWTCFWYWICQVDRSKSTYTSCIYMWKCIFSIDMPTVTPFEHVHHVWVLVLHLRFLLSIRAMRLDDSGSGRTW